MKFCTHCGTELLPGSAFCTKCAAPVPPSDTVQQSDLASATAPAVVTQLPSQTRRNLTPLFVVVAIVLLGLVAVVAALTYAGYTVKQKATSFLNGTTSSNNTSAENSSRSTTSVPAPPGNSGATQQGDDVDKGFDAIGGLVDRMGFGDPQPNPNADLELVKQEDISKIQCPAADTVAPADWIKPTAGRIPMREGLIVTGTWGRKLGDVDTSTSTSAIKPDAMTLSNNGLTFTNDDDAKGKFAVRTRILCAIDMKNAHGYSTGTYEHSPEVSPGVTSEIISSAAFQQLKQTGKLSLRYLLYIKTDDGYYKHWQQGELKRVEPEDIPYAVIVNDAITNLPVIHARGILTPEGKGAEKDTKYAINRPTMLDMKVSDDPLNPIVLFFKFEDDPFRIEVTKIEFPNQEKKIEQELSKNKKAVVYGIYFDFNSDKIKPESKQVLDEIADALKNNPDWKLTVDGHTDNIGGDAYNLDLSKRRSASVKQALVTRYHIAPDRLSSTGSGVAGAIDTNDTIIGRSHNRRVELTRQ